MKIQDDWNKTADGDLGRCLLRRMRNTGQKQIGRGLFAFLRADEEGSQLVEFALVLPIMLLIMLGITAVSITMNNYLQLTEATSNAARKVSIARGNTLDPCNDVSTAITQSAPRLNSANLTMTLALNNKDGVNLGTYGPNAGSLACSSGSYSSGAPSYLQQGGSASVTVTYPCSMTILGYNYAPGCTLQARMTEMVQ